MDQLILFHKPNKKESEMTMDHLNPWTKYLFINAVASAQTSGVQEAAGRRRAASEGARTAR
jgi:hypothetical protein